MSNVLENRPATTERPANRDALSPTLTAEIHRHLRYVLGTTPGEATPDEMLAAASHAVRNLVVDRMLVTRTRQAQSCRVAHVALTHEIGPRLAHDVHAMGLHHALDDALREVGLTLQDVARLEVPPALGTGDPADASLALLESLATHDLPATGYGLRFDYGLFRQVLVDGRQVEVPATWDAERSPWLIRRAAEAVWVPVFGRVAAQPPAPGEPASPWVDWQLLVGVPWDLPIVGHGGRTVQRLRLFSARADVDQDVSAFAPGDFTAAVRERLARESISKVVYPDDGSLEGEELRLLQAYFLCACAVRDVLREHEERGLDVRQLGRTHRLHLHGAPAALTVAELQRALVDEYRLDWDEAWSVVRGVTSWQPTERQVRPFSRRALQKVVPRHLQILDVLHGRSFTRQPLFLDGALVPGALGAVGASFVEAFPDARSVRQALRGTEGLGRLVTDLVGPGWVREPARLAALEPLAEKAEVQERFARLRSAAKIALAGETQRRSGATFDPGSQVVVHAAPFSAPHRPLLAILAAVGQALRAKDGHPGVPTAFVLAGRAASSDPVGKRVIELASAVGAWLDVEPALRGRVALRFVPDLDVPLLDRLAAAADVITCLDLPGTAHGGAASVAALRGAHTVGACNDVAIRLHEALGDDGVTLFGALEDVIGQVVRRPPSFDDPSVRRVVDALGTGPFGDFSDLRHLLLRRDRTLVLADLPGFQRALDAVQASLPRDGAARSLRTLARSGGFTSDALAQRAARVLWQLERC